MKELEILLQCIEKLEGTKNQQVWLILLNEEFREKSGLSDKEVQNFLATFMRAGRKYYKTVENFTP